MSGLILILGGILWRIGGSAWKPARRLVLPLLLTALAILAKGFSFWYIAMFLAYLVVFRLPFTLIGDDIDDASPINWIWVAVWACLLVAPSLFVAYNGLLYVGLGALIIALSAYSSNIPETSHIMTWDACEIVFGACVSLPLGVMLYSF